MNSSFISNNSDLSMNTKPQYFSTISLITLCVRMLALLVSIVSASVLLNPRLKNSLCRYLAVIAIMDALYVSIMWIVAFLLLLICGRAQDQCHPSTLYVFMILYIVISDYLTSAIMMFNILIEIVITLQRVGVLWDALWLLRHARFKVVCVTVALFSCVVYTPSLFITSITSVYKNETTAAINNQSALTYKLTQSVFSKTTFARTYLTAMSSIRILLVTLVLLLLNIITIIKFRSYLKNRLNLQDTGRPNSSIDRTRHLLNNTSGQNDWANLSPEDETRRERCFMSARANKNATIMLICLAFLYIFGNIPYLIYFMLTKAFDVEPSRVRTLNTFSQLFINLLVILKLVVFYFCNKPFRLVFRSYLKRFCFIDFSCSCSKY